jgi:hypothetical protein
VIDRETVARCIADGFTCAPGTRLRREDETKVDELVAILDELVRAVKRTSARAPVVLVDAAAGKGYVGVLAAKLVLEPLGRAATIVLIERDPGRLEAALEAAARLGVASPIETSAADVGDVTAYPASPSIVVALHACGDASDRILDCAIEAGAKQVLVVPCCVGKSTRGSALAVNVRRTLELPKSAPIERRLVHAVVDGERVLRLEAAGYETEAVELFPPRVSPYNVLLRARRVLEPTRTARSAAALANLRQFGAQE